MPKAKPKATMMVADGSGGLVQVVDHSFDPPLNWTIRFEVPKADAETWLRYFYAECYRREWSSGGIGQIDASENSGSISVNGGNPDKPQLEWRPKPRTKRLQVRPTKCARPLLGTRPN